MAGMRILYLATFAALFVPQTVFSSDKLWALLEGGGQVILVRHAITTPGAGDPPGMRLDECSTQRNLTEEGRSHARRIGEAFRKRKVPVARVLSSPWCRCIETARLAFGKAEASQPLSNLFGRQENRPKQLEQLNVLVGERPKGANLVLVSHGSTISALTGISPGTGGMVILTPQGAGRFRIAGQLSVD